VAQRILATLQGPFHYNERNYVITPSIGISIFPDHGKDVETLLMRADMAMYEAKSSRNNAQFYVPEMDADVVDRMKLESDLRSAIGSRDLCLYLQPKHDLRTGEVVGAEALLRWPHKERGWVPPSEFVVLADEAGLIEQLGNLVIDATCRRIRDWQDRNVPLTRVAINVSARQLDIGVIAEGVELEEQRDFLLRTGCVEAQGFLFSRPMSAAEFEEVLLDRGEQRKVRKT